MAEAESRALALDMSSVVIALNRYIEYYEYTIVGRSAVAVFNGELHVIARKSDGAIFDLHDDPFSGWQTTYLEGRVSGDPDVAVYGWRRRLQVAARDGDGFLNPWWTARMARGRAPCAWATIGWIARGTDNRIYRWQSKDLDPLANRTSEGWSDPELVDPERLVTGAPATIMYHGAMHIFARGLDSAIYHWSNDETWHREITGGAYTGDPDVCHFGDQLQTFGRGPDGNLQSVWYDAEAGI